MADQQLVPAVRQQQLATVRGLLEKMKGQLAMVLGDPKNVDMIVRMAITQVQRNPRLLDCSQISLLGAVMTATQLGLETDDVRGLAYLIPYGKECKLVPGYKGLQYLAMQTPGVQDFYAELVYAADSFEYQQGSDPLLTHKPEIRKDRGAVLGGYYMIVFENGYRRFHFIPRSEFDKIRDFALKNKRNLADAPWNTNEDAMQLKTCIRRGAKTLPQNSRLSTAVGLDEADEAGLPQHLDLLVDPTAVAPDGDGKDPALPTRAPRKSDKLVEVTKPAATQAPASEPARDTQEQRDSQSTQAASASAAGSESASGSAASAGSETGLDIPPPARGDRVSEATLNTIVDKMIELDRSKGSRVALQLVKERYNQESVSRITEEQAQDFVEYVNALLDAPAEWAGERK